MNKNKRLAGSLALALIAVFSVEEVCSAEEAVAAVDGSGAEGVPDQNADASAFCKGSISADELQPSLIADGGAKERRDAVAKVVKDRFSAAYGNVRRKEAFARLIDDVIAKLQRRDLAPADVAKKLTESISEACARLEAGDSDEHAAEEAFAAAGLPQPLGGASFSSGGDGGDSTYLFFLGNVNSLEADGGWKPALEASFVSVTPFFGDPLPSLQERRSLRDDSGSKIKMPEVRGFGRFEMTFSEIGEIDDGSPDDGGGGTETNPFKVGGGILRVNMGPEFVIGKGGWVGLSTGLGFTTRPSNAEGADVDARRRLYAGLMFLANYGSAEENAEHVTGRVSLGISKDKFWKWSEVDESGEQADRNESSRWYLDARIDGPGIFQSESVKLSARLFVDHPRSGDGPTDIRLSLLITTDLGGLFGN